MSTPLYNGGLVGAIDGERRPYIADDGNWSMQGTSEVPAYRSLVLYVDGVQVFGYLPAAQREAFDQAIEHDGVFTREDCLAWRGPSCVAGASVEMVMQGGNRYLGWGDTAGQDWMEWGSLDPVTLRPMLATTGLLWVTGGPDPTPIPPPADDFLDDVAEMVANVELEKSLMTAKDWTAWIAQNPGEVDLLIEYLLADPFHRTMAPPQLKTHAGRAACGILQNGVRAQDEFA